MTKREREEQQFMLNRLQNAGIDPYFHDPAPLV